jgi:Holliday junction DNA helicase RuvA
MIASLTGIIRYIDAGVLIVDVGGVGYKVNVAPNPSAPTYAVSDNVSLFVHTSVREDDIVLYGFDTMDDQKVFELLLSVNGIGPKVALGILSALDAASLADCVSAGDAKALTRVPGLGPKGAQRIILELREKMQVMAFEKRSARAGFVRSALPEDAIEADVVDGLVSLGYNRNDARKAAADAMSSAVDKTDTAGLLKVCLGMLSRA